MMLMALSPKYARAWMAPTQSTDSSQSGSSYRAIQLLRQYRAICATETDQGEYEDVGDLHDDLLSVL
jgi:hypothetical protein